MINFSIPQNPDFIPAQDLMRLEADESFSDQINKTVVTRPLPPSNLVLETAQATSLKTKWDPPSYIPQAGKVSYSATITPVSSHLRREMKVGDNENSD